MDGKYIYGIITGSNETRFDISGLGGSSPVYTIAHQGLGCALSDYSGKDFGALSKEEIIRSLLAHQRVVERVMKEHAVLPVKFGTILATSQEVRHLLAKGYSTFAEALARFHDKVEVEVAATWDIGQVLREIGTEEEIVRAKEAITHKIGPQTLEGRIRLGQLVKAYMDRRRDSYQEQMIGFLRPVAVDVQPNALVSDQMVMNVAFLVEKPNEKQFNSRVSELDRIFEGQISFRLIGPLPPYSFATVEVTKVSLEKIKEAKWLLRLGESVEEAEVRKAYRRLAAETHPDRNPGDELARARFAKLHEAATLLMACGRGQAESDGSLLVKMNRPRVVAVPPLPFPEVESVAGAVDA